MQEEKTKAPSIRGNLKLIKELREDINKLLAHISINEIENNESNAKQRLNNIENCIAKMAHYNGGNSPRICREFGIEEYKVKAKDMSRFAE